MPLFARETSFGIDFEKRLEGVNVAVIDVQILNIEQCHNF